MPWRSAAKQICKPHGVAKISVSMKHQKYRRIIGGSIMASSALAWRI
jgi:hypothetical protein